jgi:hypothetical protein
VPGPYELVRKVISLFRGVVKNPLAFIGEWQIDGGGDLLADDTVLFDLLTDRLDMRTQEGMGKGFVLAKKAEKQMFSLDVRRPELARFVARKENCAPCFLRIAV